MVKRCHKVVHICFHWVTFSEVNRIVVRWCLLLLICSAAFVRPGYGQPPYAPFPYGTLDVDNGLPQNSVYHMVEDALGFWWLGTGGGLTRYDGTSCLNFFAQPDSNHGLPAAAIRGIVALPGGDLWVGTDKGMVRYVASSGRLERVAAPSTGHSAEPVAWDSSTNRLLLWVHYQGLFYWHPATGQVDTLSIITSMHSGFYYRTLTDSAIWVAHAAGILRIDRYTGLQRHWAQPAQHFRWAGQSASKPPLLLQDGQALALQEGMWRPVPTLSRWQHEAIGVTANGYWSYGWDDTLRWVDTLGRVRFCWSDPAMEGMPAYFLQPDHRHQLWLSIEGHGLRIWDLNRHRMGILQHDTYPVGLETNFIRGLAQDAGGRVWIGFGAGGGAVWAADMYTRLGAFKLPGYTLKQVVPLPDSSVLLLTDRQTFHAVYHQDGIATRPFSLEGLLTMAAGGIDSGGHPWLAGSRQLFRWQDGGWYRQGTLAGTPKCGMWFDTSTFWYGTSAGELRVWSAGTDTALLWPGWVIQDGAWLRDTLWLATDNGLVAVDRRGNRLVHFGRQNGWPDNHVYHILPEGPVLWCPTNQGLCRLDTRSGQIRVFRPDDGLQSLECNGQAAWITHQGQYLVGGVHGLNYFWPGELADTQLHVKLVLVHLQMGEQQWLAHGTKPVLQVSYGAGDLSGTLRLLAAVVAPNMSVQIELGGYDAGWQPLSPTGLFRYAQLPPGEYTLRAKTLRSDGAVTTPVELAVIQVLRPFWMSWLFRGAAIVLLGIGVTLLVASWQRKRYHQRIKLAEQRQTLAELRMQLARDIHDDIGAGLTHLAMMSALPASADNRQKVGDKARHLLGRLNEIIWALQPDESDWDAVVADLRASAAELLEPTPVTLQFVSEQALPQAVVPPQVKHHLLLILKESIRNVIQHSSATTVTVQLQVKPHRLYLEVIDDGIGWTKKATGPGGQGLRSIQSRVAALRGACFFEPGWHGQGAQVRVEAPW